MTEQMSVLGLGGSTRSGSASGWLLRRAVQVARDRGMRPMLAPVDKLHLPMYEDGGADVAAPVAELLVRARRADAVVLCTPVYHGTVSGAVKNVLDHLQAMAGDDPPWLTGRAVGLMAVGASAVTTAQAIGALDHACRALRALTVPTVVTVAREDLVAGGTDGPPGLDERLDQMVGELLRHARVPATRTAGGP